MFHLKKERKRRAVVMAWSSVCPQIPLTEHSRSSWWSSLLSNKGMQTLIQHSSASTPVEPELMNSNWEAQADVTSEVVRVLNNVNVAKCVHLICIFIEGKCIERDKNPWNLLAINFVCKVIYETINAYLITSLPHFIHLHRSHSHSLPPPPLLPVICSLEFKSLFHHLRSEALW